MLMRIIQNNAESEVNKICITLTKNSTDLDHGV